MVEVLGNAFLAETVAMVALDECRRPEKKGCAGPGPTPHVICLAML